MTLQSRTSVRTDTHRSQSSDRDEALATDRASAIIPEIHIQHPLSDSDEKLTQLGPAFRSAGRRASVHACIGPSIPGPLRTARTSGSSEPWHDVRTEPSMRILVLSWHYPTVAAPQGGLWVERMCTAMAAVADVQVIVPTPWMPPLLPIGSFGRFRQIPDSERRDTLTIHYPRVPGSVWYLTHSLDARLAYGAVLRCARRLHAESPFDVLHAHFVYPEGVVAARVGRALGIPVLTTEHALWTPWLVDKKSQRRQVERALPHIRLVACVSEFQRANVESIVAGRTATTVLSNVLDESTFTLGTGPRDPDEILFVGLVRQVKGFDVLLRGFAEARRSLPSLRLRMLSANALRAYGSDLKRMRDLIDSLDIGDAITLVPGASPAEVACAMRRAAFVAIPSYRRETFCAVAAESLACGTPLIMTRCGGPEEFVTDADAVLVEPGDPSAFAAAIVQAMATRDRFDGPAMRERVVARFGQDAWRARATLIYDEVAAPRGKPGRASN